MATIATDCGPEVESLDSALDPLLDEIAARRAPIHLERVVTQCSDVVVSRAALDKARAFFARAGIHSPLSLVELRLRNADVSKLAAEAGIAADELHAIATAIEQTIAPAVLERLARGVARPTATGHLDPTDPRTVVEYRRLGIAPVRALERSEFDGIAFRDLVSYLVPRGPKKAVDLRPFLGDARDQSQRGTCAVFGATAVAEAFEYFRDRRDGTVDLAEQFVWWYRGAGQRYSAGGYDCGAALDDIREVGVCEEFNLPYQPVQINNNHTQVPIADKAMDRAQFYRLGDVVGLPWGDVAAVKRVLDSGRCVTYASNLDGWNTGTGEITMPPAGTQRGASHCTCIVGYIDDDSVAPELEGGFFIIRNSWGDAGNPNNIMGPEYGGHLLMPYAWYRQYTVSPVTTTDRSDPAASNQWLVEYYDNRELRGAPLVSRHVELDFVLFKIDVDQVLPQTVPAVDFNWGAGSPVHVTLPILGDIDVLPTDNFSVRYSKVIRFREGWYRFRLRGDDGLRLYIDDRLVINQWKGQSSTEYIAEHHVTGGDHIVRVEYFEAGGVADVHLGIEPVQWHYELFRGATVSGTPSATFDDTLTELEWRHAPPVSPLFGGVSGQFALRGTARLTFKPGTYRFHATHTGAFRLYVDGVLRHDDPSGTLTSSAPVAITGGAHDIRIEFDNASRVPSRGSGSYFRALCKFGWSDETWNAKFYDNARARELVTNNELAGMVDANYVFFHTSGLTGDVRVDHEYPRDSGDDLSLRFPSWSAFVAGVPGWPSDFIQPDSNPPTPTSFFGVWVNRKVFIPATGYYNVALDAGEGFRVIVDGKELAGNREFIGDDLYNADVLLDAGVHDVSIEYNVTQWGGVLNLAITRVEWSVSYFPGKGVTGSPAVTTTFNTIAEVSSRSAVAYRDNDFSATATRQIWLPVGRYFFAVKADDGVRLVVNDRTLIDAWVDEAPTDYTASYEHRGGWVTVRVEYYQGFGGKTLQMTMRDQDFYGEYYRGTTLNVLPSGSTARRIAPIAYRYETDIDFDFGQGSYLTRVGASDFSARWMGRVQLPVGRWRIDATSDDGIRVYLDGRLLIDSWIEQGATTHSRQLDLTGRPHDVKVEYFQKSGAGVCRVKYVRMI